MRLREFKDEVEQAASMYRVWRLDESADTPMLRVARRVADLYEECPMCHDDGMAVPVMGVFGCPRCDWSGVCLGSAGIALANELDTGEAVDTLEALARYLFGENT